jgi:hypothetical protein
MKICSILFWIFILILLAGTEALNGQTLRGRVTEINGDPLAGAGVTITGTYIGVQTGADGNYSFT